MGALKYIWRVAGDCPNELIATHDRLTVDPTLFRQAKPLSPGMAGLFRHSGNLADFIGEKYIPNSAGLPLVSAEASVEIARLGGDIQQVPATVVCADGQMSCVIVNPLKSVAAVDWNSSKAIYIPGTKQVMKFQALRLVESALCDIVMARLEEYRPFVLVSDDVRQIFRTSGMCEFEDPGNIKP